MTETTTETVTQLRAIYNDEQIARLMTLNAVGDLVKSAFGNVNTESLLALSNYVIGEPVEEIVFDLDEFLDSLTDQDECADCELQDSCEGFGLGEFVAPKPEPEEAMAEWERELLSGWPAFAEPLVVTVEDLTGFLTLPKTAILEDPDGDIWNYEFNGDDPGWTFPGSFGNYDAETLFITMGDEDYKFPMIVTNPEVLDDTECGYCRTYECRYSDKAGV